MRTRVSLIVFMLVFCTLIGVIAAAEKQPVRPPIAYDAVGSWFGRAVPMSPFCTPGSAGCPVPREIVMLPTFFADGNFIGIDSQTFGGGAHTTAHGEWLLSGPDTVSANFVFLQSGADDLFVGGFRMRLQGEMVTPDLMIGKINAFFFPFTDETGAVVLDPETGYPVPDPLTPLGDFIENPADCNPASGCVGVFEFSLRRVGPK